MAHPNIYYRTNLFLTSEHSQSRPPRGSAFIFDKSYCFVVILCTTIIAFCVIIKMQANLQRSESAVVRLDRHMVRDEVRSSQLL